MGFPGWAFNYAALLNGVVACKPERGSRVKTKFRSRHLHRVKLLVIKTCCQNNPILMPSTAT